MKKIILTTIITFVFVSYFVSAHWAENHNMQWNEKMQQFRMNVMKIQNEFMERLKKEVDEQTRIKLDEMIINRRQDMKKMMNSNLSEQEREKVREEMRKKHFWDLKNVLKNYPKLYEKYSKEMEEIMKDIQSRRETMMKKTQNMPVYKIKKLSLKDKKQIDKFLDRYFKRLEEKWLLNEKLNKILAKIEKRKAKINNPYVLEIINYLEEKIREKLKNKEDDVDKLLKDILSY